jgi:thiamine-monophosphate kinase
MTEFERIEAFVSQFDRRPPPFGPGDDAAVLPRTALQSCVTTDAVVEGVHFTRQTFSLEDIGHKALAVNLSDLAAMGATPSWVVCALGVPRGFSAPSLKALGRGMAALARIHGVALVGGNFTASPVLSLTLTVTGALEGTPMLRSAAQVGDVVYVSGPLGLASAGLEVLTTKQRGFEHLVAAQRRPVPHLAWARTAAAFATAGIDVSDGLVQDLGHIARASGVNVDIERAAIALDSQLVAWARGKAMTHALTGGEDYVVAVAVSDPAEFEKAMGAVGFEVFRIGRVRRGIGVTVDGAPLRGRTGFQHA